MRLQHYLACWILLGCSLGALAQPHPNERDYIIELLIFAQNPGQATELPSPPKHYPLVVAPALALGTTPAWDRLTLDLDTRAQYLPQELELVKEAQALANNANYRLLFHQAWQMHLVGEERSLNLLVEGGDYYGWQPELQGQIKLSVARYLHLETDLYLNTFTPITTETTTYLPLVPEPTLEQLQEVLGTEATILAGTYQLEASAGMHQRRRMRSGELHFIDSPYLGLLIKIQRAPTTAEATAINP